MNFSHFYSDYHVSVYSDMPHTAGGYSQFLETVLSSMSFRYPSYLPLGSPGSASYTYLQTSHYTLDATSVLAVLLLVCKDI